GGWGAGGDEVPPQQLGAVRRRLDVLVAGRLEPGAAMLEGTPQVAEAVLGRDPADAALVGPPEASIDLVQPGTLGRRQIHCSGPPRVGRGGRPRWGRRVRCLRGRASV